MRTFAQVLLLAWFIVISLFVFVPSWFALTQAPTAVAVVSPPVLPIAPAAADEKSVALYTQQVAAYQQVVLAYTSYVQMSEKLKPTSAYELVVTKTFLPLLDKMIVAMLGYAFVVAAATTIDNANRLRNSKEPQPLKFF